ncbi:hypothetical protein CLOLEP_03238 [[Clostridium] leptum DSM 753]|jgi:hypothetical protein|uniref:Uncharacterized protein n=1 Tax=[Clostridium] leptum DSM 753 TaxID=428125 RepID=A7VXB5_9FIRM|nr:hypothetical protein CLOLEP_03238 [[Clostridium] leptum DSM 753]
MQNKRALMQTALMLFLSYTTKEIPAQAQTQKKKAPRKGEAHIW